MLSFKQSIPLILAAANAGDAYSTKMPPYDLQQHLLNQMGGLSGVYSTLGSPHRKVQETECPETPFLWKIIESESGKHVGFGLGTMHLPAELLLSDESYMSIISAVADSCDVYGELNLLDLSLLLELQQCLAPLVASAATIADIPDEDIKALYEAKVMEIATLVASDPSLADGVYQGLIVSPLFDIQQTIINYNTPEYDPYFLASLTGVPPVVALDAEVLSIGRIPGGIEEVSTQCGVMEKLYVGPEDIDTSKLLWNLNHSLSGQISAYKCGDVAALDAALDVEGEIGNNTELEMALLDNRNEQMAAAIANILSTSDNRAFFAIGFLHWLYGDKSLNNLLNDYGYSLELVPNYGPDDADDLSNEQCGVEYNVTSNLFELTETSTAGTSTDAPVASDLSSAPTASNSPTESPAADNDPDNSSHLLASTFAPFMCIFVSVYFI